MTSYPTVETNESKQAHWALDSQIQKPNMVVNYSPDHYINETITESDDEKVDHEAIDVEM